MAQRDSPSQDPVVREMFDTLYGPSGGTQAPVGPGFFASNPATTPLAAGTQAGTAAAPTPTSIWRFNAPTGDTHGPFQAFVGGAFFVDTFDRVLYWGYNGSDGGGNVVATEPKLTLQIESDYNDGTGHRLELYYEYAKASGATGPASYRPWFVQIDRANGNVLSYQFNATNGFSLNTTDGLSTQWGTLTRNAFTTTPAAGNNQWTMGWVAGGQNTFQISNGTMSFQLQPVSAGGQPWQIIIGGASSIQMNTHGLQAGDPNASNQGALQATVTVADAAAKHTLWLQAQASQSTSLIFGVASDGATTLWYSDAAGTWFFGRNGQSTVVGKGAALANTATDGFLYIPTVVGTPTGVPTARAGSVAMEYDTTANKLWIYSGAWRGVVVA